MLIQKVNNKIVYINKYALIKIFLNEIITSEAIITAIIIKIHLMFNFKTNILIKINIIIF